MIYRRMKSLWACLVAVLACTAMFSACSDDDAKMPVLGKGQSAWLELQAEYTFTGVNAFANIFEGSASGQRLLLPDNCKILANGLKLNYLDMPPEYDLFSYGATITGTDLDVKYEVNLPDGTVYNASVDLENAPVVAVPDAYGTIENGKSYFIFLEVMHEPISVRVQLVNANNDAYEAEIVGNATFVFRDVPAGTYSLRYITTSSSYLSPRGSVVGGVIRACRLSMKSGVIVKP